jgi:hypothetical protein
VTPAKFLFALVVVCIPAALLDKRSATGYAILILVSFAAYNAAGLRRFANFVAGELKA